MNLIIHDLTETDFMEIVPSINKETMVISDNETIHSCVGCYGCWIKTPGTCIFKDAYGNIGQLFSKCGKITVISKCEYGGYSPFVKNVWDRSISYLLPYFTKMNNETHHKMRYDNKFTLVVHFYGNNISQNELLTAEKLIKANCVNFNAMPKIHFHNSFAEIKESIV
jgi:multimeric flavodoxin WrbA